MDLSKAPPARPAEAETEPPPAFRRETGDALSPSVASSLAIAASRSVLVRTIALLS